MRDLQDGQEIQNRQNPVYIQDVLDIKIGGGDAEGGGGVRLAMPVMRSSRLGWLAAGLDGWLPSYQAGCLVSCVAG